MTHTGAEPKTKRDDAANTCKNNNENEKKERESKNTDFEQHFRSQSGQEGGSSSFSRCDAGLGHTFAAVAALQQAWAASQPHQRVKILRLRFLNVDNRGF